MTDPWLRDRLRRLATPPARAGFHDELMMKIRERDLVALRRWRRASIALAVVAAGAIAAAGVLAASGGSHATRAVIDRTYSCAVAPNHGFPKLRVGARVETGRYSATAYVGTTADPSPGDDNYDFLWLGTKPYKDFPLFGADPKGCRITHRAVALARSGLPKDNVYTPSFLGGFDGWCRVTPGRVDIRLRVTLDGSGVPTRATIVARSEKRNAPVAYVEWSTAKVTSYLSPGCQT